MRLARRLATDALGRLAREVDRLTVALQTPPTPRSLRPTTPDGSTSDRVEPTAPVFDVRPAPPRPAPPPSAPAEPSAAPASRPPDRPPTPSSPDPLAAASPDPPPEPPGELPAPVVPQTPSMAQVAHLRRRLEPHVALLHEHVGWAQAEDPIEALRRLRVATRRLRAFTRLFAPLIGDARARRLHKKLRRVTRGVGPLREWDVLLEGLQSEHDQAEPLLRAALEHVIVDGRRRRAEAAKAAEQAVARVDVRALAQALDRELDLICGRLLRLDDRLPAQTWALLQPTLTRTFAEIPRPEHEHEIEPLHEVRVRAKRLRYALELLRPTLGEAYRPLRKPAKRIQRAIGEHHDHSLLASLLGEHRAALQKQGLSTLAEALRPLEERLLIQRRAAHATAAPALEWLEHRRYRQLTAKALGITLEADDASDPAASIPPTESGVPTEPDTGPSTAPARDSASVDAADPIPIDRNAG